MEFTAKPNPSVKATKAERKITERNRRDHMKTLYSQLNSLLPHSQGSSTPRAIPLPDQLEEATKYIRELKDKLEKLKREREQLLGTAGGVRHTRRIGSDGNKNNDSSGSGSRSEGYKSPKIEVHERGGAIEIILTTGLECQFIFNEAIRILHEESTEVVNAGFTVAQDTVFHTIHAKTEEVVSSHKAARISERLKRFIIDP